MPRDDISLSRLLHGARYVAGAVQHRVDSWINRKTGTGLSEDKIEHQSIDAPVRLSDRQIEYLMVGDTLARRIVDAPVEDAMRQGFGIESDNQDAADEALKAALDEHDLLGVVTRALIEGRAYGGVGLFVRVEDGTDWQEGSPLVIGSGDYMGVEMLRPSQIYVQDYVDDIYSNRYRKPVSYRLQLEAPRGQGSNILHNIHPSRVVRCEPGVRMQSRINRAENYGFPDSVLQPVYARLQEFAAATRGVLTLLTDASQTVYSIQGLNQALQREAGAEDLIARFLQIDALRSGTRSILLDSDGERFERVATPMAEMADVLDRAMMLVSQASGIPVSRLFGTAPAGLNATGDHDLHVYYDSVQTIRERYAEPLIRRKLEIMVPGMLPDGYTITWPSLWQMTPAEQAAVELQVAQRDQIYISALVYDPEDVEAARSEPDGWTKRVTPKSRVQLLPEDLNPPDVNVEAPSSPQEPSQPPEGTSGPVQA